MTFSRSLAFALALLLLAGCISTSSEPDIVATRLLPTPVPVIPPTSFNIQAGAASYTDNCAPCHGATGLGDGPAAAGFSCAMPALLQRSPDVKLRDWYTIAYNGKRSSDTCIMPPWNQRLTPEQIWHTVAYAYTLRYENAAGGATVLASLENADTANFSDSNWQVGNSDTDILRGLTNNFSTTLAPDDQKALLAYIRAQTYAVAEIALVSTEEAVPPPVSTEEVAAPAPITTEEATDTSTFSLNGTLTNGSAGGTVPVNQTITLRVVGLSEAGEPQDLYNADVTTDATGKFSFVDVPRSARSLAMLQTEYGGIRQFSEQIFPGALGENVLEVTFPVYEMGADPSAIRLSYTEALVDAVTAESSALIYQTFEFINPSDRILAPTEGRTLQMPLPPGVLNPQVISTGGETGRFELVLEGDHYVVYDTQALVPGRAEQITVAYNFAYEGEMTLKQSFAYPVEQIGIYVATTHNLQVESAQLIAGENAALNDITYRGYRLNGAALAPGEVLQYRVYDGSPFEETTAQEEASGNFLQDNTTLILGIGVLMILAGGMFLMYDLQKTRLLAQGASTPVAPRSRRELMAAIVALDDAYEAGDIAEKEYQQERATLKAALMALEE